MIDDALRARLHDLERRVAIATHRFREVDDAADDALRGLYLTDEHIDRLLADPGLVVPAVDAEPVEVTPTSPLGHLCAAFALSPIDADILVTAAAPDLDRRFERFYGYLQDDVTRRRASPGLVMDLLGGSPFDSELRSRFGSDGPLVDGGLLRIEDGDRPLLTRALRVPDRVVAALLGDDRLDPDLRRVAVSQQLDTSRSVAGLARALSSGDVCVYLRQRSDAGAIGLATRALHEVEMPALAVDLERAHPDDRLTLAELAIREARLRGGGLVVGPIDGLHPDVLRAIAEGSVTTLFHGSMIWDPRIALRSVLTVDLSPLDGPEQQELWRRVAPASIDVGALSTTFRLGPSQIARAAAAGRTQAALNGGEPDVGSFAAGARTQNSVGLERLARRVAPKATWTDIVLPDQTVDQLHHLVTRIAHRHQVLDEWGLRRGGGRGEGVAALFAGESGTGKTLAAEVIANALGHHLYVIDLSSVVDKYIGETEKNLDRVFSEAEGVNGVLFFDEADALFGKRSEISDAKDRYANVEVAYLLQRMEQYDGLAILASNLRGNLDEAFARRLSLVVDFAEPDPPQRRALWSVLIGAAPLDAEVDLDFLAERFVLSGGNIRNIAVTAAYLAADANRTVDMAMLIRGVQLEYRKLGRLCLESEFGPYLAYLDDTDDRQPKGPPTPGRPVTAPV
ncbi:MAG: AAA family ATPase [Actinomycetota bacterium]